MRILHLNHTGVVSGAERSLLTLVSELRSRHDVMLAAPEGELLQRARHDGLRVAAVRGMHGSLRMHPWRTPRALASTLASGAQVRRLARSEQIDVVHANSVRAGLIAAVAHLAGGPPCVVHARDLLGVRRPAAATRSLLARTATEVVAVSDFVATDWRDVPIHVSRVHNPIDCERFRPDADDGAAWRAAAGIPHAAPLIAVVGQITPWKRQLLALQAFSTLLERAPDSHLVIAGEVKFATSDTAYDNPAYERLLHDCRRELGLEPRAHFLGEREDAESVMRAADVLLSPAHDEPFGRAVAEALATGTPAVVATPGGPTEFLRDGSDGVVVGSNDPERWADACTRALDLARDVGLTDSRRRHVCAVLSKEGHATAMETVLARATGRELRV